MNRAAVLELARWLVHLIPAGLLAVGSTACTRPPGPPSMEASTAITSAALEHLFVNREHARSIQLWSGKLENAPLFGSPVLRRAVTGDSSAARLVLADIDVPKLEVTIPVQSITIGMLESHFREHPAGWDVWFRRFPGGSGIVEVTRPVRGPDDAVTLFVGRACGEHCFAAWRLVVSERQDSTWRVDSVIPLPLPRS